MSAEMLFSICNGAALIGCDSQKLGVSHWLVIPCLILTFMIGPIGFLAYHLASLKARRRETV